MQEWGHYVLCFYQLLLLVITEVWVIYITYIGVGKNIYADPEDEDVESFSTGGKKSILCCEN